MNLSARWLTSLAAIHLCCVFHYSFAMTLPVSVSADDCISFCLKCNGHDASDGLVSARLSRNAVNKEVIMLYDLDRAQQVLSGATLAVLPESTAPVQPARQPGQPHCAGGSWGDNCLLWVICVNRIGSLQIS